MTTRLARLVSRSSASRAASGGENQQWLMHDQQRGAMDDSDLVHMLVIELPQHGLYAPDARPTSSSGRMVSESVTRQINRTLLEEPSAQREQTLNAQAEPQSQRQQVYRLQAEMSALQRRYEDKCSELEEVNVQLQAERLNNRHGVGEQRNVWSQRVDRIMAELESADINLHEERNRSAELMLQLDKLKRAFQSQQEQGSRISTALRQKVERFTRDIERERMYRQSIQHLLRQAQDQIRSLESAPACWSQSPSALDESLLECPKCGASYPTSQYVAFMSHIERCMA